MGFHASLRDTVCICVLLCYEGVWDSVLIEVKLN